MLPFMKMLYLILLAVFIVVCIIVCRIIVYCNTYDISDDETSLENVIEEHLNNYGITIEKTADIDNIKYVLFSTHEYFGWAELRRGLNGKYSFEDSKYEESLFKLKITKTKESKYFIIFGKNYGMEIKYATVELNDKVYSLAIPQEEYYIAFCPISKRIKTQYPKYNDFRLYDADNNDVTHDVYIGFS